MAAVQANPAMQQQQHQGNNAAMMAANILPPGMTKEAVQQIYKVCDFHWAEQSSMASRMASITDCMTIRNIKP